GRRPWEADATNPPYGHPPYAGRPCPPRHPWRGALTAAPNPSCRARQPQIWGEGTTACASDSRKFTAWDQNLMTEWHVRYGGRGGIIFLALERQRAPHRSPFKRCSSSLSVAQDRGGVRPS